MYEENYPVPGGIVKRDYNYGEASELTVRESEISREYSKLMKAITELAMTCENLEGAFAPVLRSQVEPAGLSKEANQEVQNSTEHGIALQQARNSVERTTRQVRSLIARKEI